MGVDFDRGRLRIFDLVDRFPAMVVQVRVAQLHQFPYRHHAGGDQALRPAAEIEDAFHA
jgi:hypothetical protein